MSAVRPGWPRRSPALPGRSPGRAGRRRRCTAGARCRRPGRRGCLAADQAPADDDSTECHAGHANRLLRFRGDSFIVATVRLRISWLAQDPQPAHLLTRIGNNDGSPWAADNPTRATRPLGMPRRRRLNAKRWWLFNDLVPGTRQPAMVRQRRYPGRRRVSPAGAPPGSPAFCKMAADGSPVASCSSFSSGTETTCKPAMKSPRPSASSGVCASAAHPLQFGRV